MMYRNKIYNILQQLAKKRTKLVSPVWLLCTGFETLYTGEVHSHTAQELGQISKIQPDKNWGIVPSPIIQFKNQ